MCIRCEEIKRDHPDYEFCPYCADKIDRDIKYKEVGFISKKDGMFYKFKE